MNYLTEIIRAEVGSKQDRLSKDKDMDDDPKTSQANSKETRMNDLNIREEFGVDHINTPMTPQHGTTGYVDHIPTFPHAQSLHPATKFENNQGTGRDAPEGSKAPDLGK